MRGNGAWVRGGAPVHWGGWGGEAPLVEDWRQPMPPKEWGPGVIIGAGGPLKGAWDFQPLSMAKLYKLNIKKGKKSAK